MNFKSIISGNEVFEAVAAAAEKLDVKTYIVGGYVRDLIMQRPQKQDIDFVCVGSGEELANRVAAILSVPNVITFKRFGTAMLRYKNLDLEFVGARKESYRSDSRKPVVENGTLEDDQKRRDFTINAMGISLNRSDLGELIDPFDGVNDLKKKIIRTPLDPDITFSDDPLRMMRAVRFAGQLNFDIDADTFSAITSNAERIKIVSQERISDELNKIILCDKPSYPFKLLFQAKLLHIIFPEMTDLHGVESFEGKSHKDNFYHTLQVLDNLCAMSGDLWLRWAAILHDIAKPATKRFDKKSGWTFHGHEEKGARMVPKIFRNLRLPLNEKMRFVQKLVRLHLRPIALVKETITDSAIRRLLVEAGEDTDALMMLCRADITSKDLKRKERYLENFNRVERRMREVEESDRLRNFQPVISGEIIMQALGLKPSREVGDIKIAIREAILDGKIKNDFDQAWDLMLKIAAFKGFSLLEGADKENLRELSLREAEMQNEETPETGC
jgi:putative nucleotidyltransferase with HDIG domain